MLKPVRKHLTYANVMATIAVFIAHGGTAMAAFIVNSNADIASNTVSGSRPPAGAHSNIMAASIGTADIGGGQISKAKMANNAIDSPRVVDGSLTGTDVA